jgi:putative membrane protein
MPYQNFIGWMGTGALFMTVASLVWGRLNQPILSRQQILFPAIIYAGNFAFALILSFNAGFYVPAMLGIVVGALPLALLYFTTPVSELTEQAIAADAKNPSVVLPVVNAEQPTVETIATR